MKFQYPHLAGANIPTEKLVKLDRFESEMIEMNKNEITRLRVHKAKGHIGGWWMNYSRFINVLKFYGENGK